MAQTESPMKNANTKPTQSEANASMVLEANLRCLCPSNRRSLQEAIDESQREFNVRERCFPKWVDEGRLTKSDARDRLERLAAACYFLSALSHGDLESCIAAMDDGKPLAPADTGTPF